MLAVSLPAIWLGVIAFLGMLAGAIYAVTTPSSASPGDTQGPSGGGGGHTGPTAPNDGHGGTFMGDWSSAGRSAREMTPGADGRPVGGEGCPSRFHSLPRTRNMPRLRLRTEALKH